MVSSLFSTEPLSPLKGNAKIMDNKTKNFILSWCVGRSAMYPECAWKDFSENCESDFSIETDLVEDVVKSEYGNSEIDKIIDFARELTKDGVENGVLGSERRALLDWEDYWISKL